MKSLLMRGFKPRISGVGGDRSTNWTTTFEWTRKNSKHFCWTRTPRRRLINHLQIEKNSSENIENEIDFQSRNEIDEFLNQIGNWFYR